MWSDLVMPVLLVNMGGEMLYILEQRLDAQSIVPEKSKRVLDDVISTMLNTEFVEQMFTTTKVYTDASTRLIFDRIAHSSCMRLNETSMDKLYDLMTMGFKRQVLQCAHYTDIIQVTLNHLEALEVMATKPSTQQLVKDVTMTFQKHFEKFREFKFYRLRHALLDYFQDKKVKISIFLQEDLQDAFGSLLVFHDGMLPHGFDTPGFIRYFDSKGQMDKTDTLQMVNAKGTKSPPELNDIYSSGRPCTLGGNMYSNDKKVQGDAVRGGKSKDTQDSGSGNSKTRQAKVSMQEEMKAAKKELDLLAGMIGKRTSVNERDTFTISNLFPDNNDDDEGGISTGMVSKVHHTHVHHAGYKDMMSKFGDMMVVPKGKGEAKGSAIGAHGGPDVDADEGGCKGAEEENDDDGDDLLAMMDSIKDDKPAKKKSGGMDFGF